jgi:DNA-binding transcriptional LysR family regulator
MAFHTKGVAGRVRLGTGATACIYLLPPLLRDIRRRFPQLDVVVSTGNTPEILKALAEIAIDIALVTLPAPDRMFAATPLVDDEIVAVFPYGMRPPNARRVIDDWFRDAGVSLKPVIELGSIEAIKQLVGAGLGCGLLPRLAADGSAPAGTLLARSLSPALYRRLGVVLRRDKKPDRGLREVLRVLSKLGHADGLG